MQSILYSACHAYSRWAIKLLHASTSCFLGLLLILIINAGLKAQTFYHDVPPYAHRNELESLISGTHALKDSLHQKFYKFDRVDMFEIKDRIHAIPDGYFDVFVRSNNHWKNQYNGVFGEYNYGSVKFIIDDKIYSYGGSGYWRSVHSVIGFLSEKREWELLKFAEDLPEGIAYVHSDELRIFGLHTSARIVLATGQYENLPKDSVPNIISVNHKHFLENEKWLFTKDSVNLYLTSKEANTSYLIHMKNTPFYKAGSQDFYQIMSDSVIIYSKEGTVYTFIPQEAIKTATLLKKEDSGFIFSLSAIFFIFFLMIILWIYNRRHESNEEILNKEIKQKYENSIISALLSYRGRQIDIHLLDELLGIRAELNTDTKKYKRAQLIKEVNDTFEVETNQKLIIRVRENEDGRKYIYQIN